MFPYLVPRRSIYTLRGRVLEKGKEGGGTGLQIPIIRIHIYIYINLAPIGSFYYPPRIEV